MEYFCFTYGDGLCDVNIGELIKFHKEGNQLATLTATKPPGRFGSLKLANNNIESFKEKPKNLEDLDPKLLETYKKLGIPLQEQKRLNGIAVDAVFDSVSVATTFKDTLTEKGIIFCSISEAIQKYPDLVKKYLGSVIPITDHFFATLTTNLKLAFIILSLALLPILIILFSCVVNSLIFSFIFLNL